MLVDTVRGFREERERMAAPKSLEPEETPARVSGIMRFSVRRRIVERRVMGSFMIVVVVGAPEEEVVDAILKLKRPEDLKGARGLNERTDKSLKNRTSETGII